MSEKLKLVVQRLARVARKNKDEFKFKVEVGLTRAGGLLYRFVSQETAEGHEFCTAQGLTIDDAAEAAMADIGECCKAWGYKDCE